MSNFRHYYGIELTRTSNVIEGNSLSPVETTLAIKQGITIRGKPVKDLRSEVDGPDASLEYGVIKKTKPSVRLGDWVRSVISR